MAFIKGTQVFTDSGYKNIEDISGHDKVLVRNFLGEAQFIQPFALKKSLYRGDIVDIGGRYWSISVTPRHHIMYDCAEYENKPKYRYVPAEDINISRGNRIQRRFRYIIPDEPVKEIIRISDRFGERSATIDNYDWYTLVAYVLTRGYIRKSGRRDALLFYVRDGKLDEDISNIGGILNKYGIPWSISNTSQTVIVVGSRNTLAARMVTRLGSRKRREMYLPDKMVFGSSRGLIRAFMDTLIDCSMRPETERSDWHTISTSNTRLIDSLSIMGTVGGYSITKRLKLKAGVKSGIVTTKRDSYNVHITRSVDTYSLKYSRRKSYSGHVYEVDLFDGQIYVKNGRMPIWLDPK